MTTDVGQGLRNISRNLFMFTRSMGSPKEQGTRFSVTCEEFQSLVCLSVILRRCESCSRTPQGGVTGWSEMWSDRLGSSYKDLK